MNGEMNRMAHGKIFINLKGGLFIIYPHPRHPGLWLIEDHKGFRLVTQRLFKTDAFYKCLGAL